MRVVDQPTGYLASPYQVYDVEDSVERGRVVKKSVLKEFDPVKNMGQYKVEDFYLENLIAAGAVDMLKPLQYSTMNMDAMDAVNGIVNAMASDILDNNDNNTDE